MCQIFFPNSLEPRGDIHGISEDGIVESFFGPDIPNDDIPTRDPDTEVDRFDSLLRNTLVEYWKCLSHEECCSTGSDRMIWHIEWCSEKSHHRVPDILIKGTTLFDEDVGHMREVLCHHREEYRRTKSLRDRCEVRNIREENTHRLRLPSELDIAPHFCDLLNHNWIDIVTEILLELTALSIDDEESIDESDGE